MNKISIKNFAWLCLFLLFLQSCKTQQKQELNYMKDIDAVVTEASVANASTTIQPGDQLGIWVSAQDMEAVSPFNQNYSQLPNVQNTQGSGNRSQVAPTGQLPTYTVRTDHTIQFPVIGELSTEGLTVEEFTDQLTKKMTKYIYQPTVQVQTLNYKVTVLGEVARPGTFNVPDGQVTLLTALGLAGDLTKYAVRNEVLVVRNQNGTITKEKVDLTSANFINSPFYFLKQNDVVYVSSNDTVAKQSRLDPNAGIYISVASIVVTILALVFKK